MFYLQVIQPLFFITERRIRRYVITDRLRAELQDFLLKMRSLHCGNMTDLKPT